MIDNTTAPLRTARQVFEGVLEETEEITFTLKRSRKVTVNTETAAASDPPTPRAATHSPSSAREFVDSSRADDTAAVRGRIGGREHEGLSLSSAQREGKRELVKRDGPAALDPYDGPRQLPPA